jgi:ABC-type transport system involved in cytochrome bd biosynthesis fused ATPase/permease subunit
MDMQNPKFLKATIRENIILGQEFYEKKFNKILEVVDFNLDKYEGRDLTEIVEGQRNISMEDKRRILMARLLYIDADIVLINQFFDQLSKDQQ